MSNDSNLRDAITYLLDAAEPEGLEAECLECFSSEVTRLMNTKRPITREDYMKAAGQALYEWDI